MHHKLHLIRCNHYFVGQLSFLAPIIIFGLDYHFLWIIIFDFQNHQNTIWPPNILRCKNIYWDKNDNTIVLYGQYILTA